MSILSKSIAAGAALGMLHGASAPVFAGPYVNIENNAWQGSEFGAAVTETRWLRIRSWRRCHNLRSGRSCLRRY